MMSLMQADLQPNQNAWPMLANQKMALIWYSLPIGNFAIKRIIGSFCVEVSLILHQQRRRNSLYLKRFNSTKSPALHHSDKISLYSCNLKNIRSHLSLRDYPGSCCSIVDYSQSYEVIIRNQGWLYTREYGIWQKHLHLVKHLCLLHILDNEHVVIIIIKWQ